MTIKQELQRILEEAQTNRNVNWRYGQAVFNIAESVYPATVNRLRGSEVDCFYIDEKIPLFLKAIKDDLNG